MKLIVYREKLVELVDGMRYFQVQFSFISGLSWHPQMRSLCKKEPLGNGHGWVEPTKKRYQTNCVYTQVGLHIAKNERIL